jgi:hypothetical protein
VLREIPPTSDDSAAIAGTEGPIVLRRAEGRVVLTTSGSLDEVVEALLVRLDDVDPSVRAAVEGRLEGIAAEAGLPRRYARVEEGDAPWWRSTRGRAALAAVEAPSASREPWSAWWSRVRGELSR